MTPDEVIAAVHARVPDTTPASPPEGLLALARACTDWDAPEDADGADQTLWSALIPILPVGPMAHSGVLYPEDRMRACVELVAWAITRLLRFEREDDEGLNPEVRLAMMILRLAHPDDRVWSLLPAEMAALTALRDLAVRVVSGLSPRAMMLDSRAFSLRPERLELPFPQGGRGWSALARAITAHEVLSPGLLGPFAQILARLWPDALAQATAEWTDALALFALTDALAPADAFRLGRTSGNRVSAFVSVINHTALFRPIGGAAEDALTEALVDVGSDLQVWQAWMEALNVYPVRLPMLQAPLGRALARLPADAFQSWLTTQALLPNPVQRGIAMPDRPDAATCLAAFAQSATGGTRVDAWARVWAHWNAWDFGGRDLILDIHASALDLGVVGHVLEGLDASESDILIAREAASLRGVFSEWWPSSSAMISEIRRIQSRLQPLAHAQTLRAKGAAVETAKVLYAIQDIDLEWKLGRLRVQ